MKKVILMLVLAFGVGMAEEVADECLNDKSGKSCFEAGIYSLMNRGDRGEDEPSYLYDLDDAENNFKKACERDKSYCDYLVRVDYARAGYYASKANGYLYDYDKKDYKQAEIYFKKACLKDKSYCDYEERINQAKGDDYFAKKDYTQADIYYNKVCKNGYDCINIGKKYAEIKDEARAEFYYKKACLKDKNYCDYEERINQAKGDDYLAKKDYAQAENYYKKACEKSKSSEACVDYMKGAYYSKKFNKEEANSYFKRACEKDKDGDICNSIYSIDSHSITSFVDEVDFYLNKACEKNLEYCDNGYIGKGRVFFEKKDYKQAEFYLKQACKKQKEKKEKEDEFGRDCCEDYRLYGVGMYLLRNPPVPSDPNYVY